MMTRASRLAHAEAAFDRAVARIGEPIRVRRYTGTGAGRAAFEVTVRARVAECRPNELAGNIVQGDRRVILAVADLVRAQFPLPVRISDKLVVRGKELAIVALDDETRRLGGRPFALEIIARG